MNIRFLGYSRIDGFPLFYLPNGREGEIFLREVQKQGKYDVETIQIEKKGKPASQVLIFDIARCEAKLIGFYNGRFGVGCRSAFSEIPGHFLSKDVFFFLPDFFELKRLPNVIKDFEIEKMEIDGRFIKLVIRDRNSYWFTTLAGSRVTIGKEIKKDFDLFTKILVRRDKLIKINESKDSTKES